MPTLNRTSRMLLAAWTALLLAACGQSAPEPSAAPAVASSAVAATAIKPVPVNTVAAAPAAAVTAPARVAAVATAPPAATPAAPSTVFRVSAVTLGTAVDDAQRVTRPTTHFVQTDKTLYASVASTGKTGDATLSARWNYLRGEGMVISNVSQQLAADGPATTTFTLENPDLWPEGKYNVEVSLDGKVVNTQAFTIGK